MINRTELKELLSEIIEPIVSSSIEKAMKSSKNKGQNSEEEILNFIEAQKFMGNIPKGTLYGLTSQNKIKHIKRGRRLYFKKSDLLNYIEEGLILSE